MKALLSLLTLASAAALSAQPAVSETVGWFRHTAPAQSDTLVSTVFSRPPAWRGELAAVAGSELTVAGAPDWVTDFWIPTAGRPDRHHVRVLSGALAGHFLTIAGNGADTLLVDDAGLELGALAPDDVLEIAPYWTLGTLLPAAHSGTAFVASASPLARQTEVLVYDALATGLNRAPSWTFYFCNGAWRRVGAPVSQSFDATVLPPDAYVLLRNKAAATTTVHAGFVSAAPLASVLTGRSGGRNDNLVALAWPLDVTLRDSGLAEDGAFAASPSPLARTDELLVFDPAGTGFNRAPSATYYRCNHGWRRVGAAVATDFSDTVTLPAGAGFIVRKAAGAPAVTWTFLPNL